jgi:hypothetical protein
MSDIHETERERANEPAWIKDGMYMKLPMKDKDGRSAYLDLTYIIPFGDMITGEFFSRQVNMETGLPESYPESFIKKAPLFNLISEIGKNQDFYGNKIWKDSDSIDKRLSDIGRHMMRAYLPPLAGEALPGGYKRRGKQVGKRRPSIVERARSASAENQYRTGMQEFMRNLGLKIQPVNVDLQEKYMEWEKKRALETLLGEHGILQTYERTFLPKK